MERKGHADCVKAFTWLVVEGTAPERKTAPH